jgi:hypothetical protein
VDRKERRRRIDIDIFAPGRQDWLDGTAAHYIK